MNSKYSDYVTTADTVLDGSLHENSSFGDPRIWTTVYAHEDITFELTSDTNFDESGDALDVELISVGGGSYYYMYATKITHKSGKATYYRNEAI